MAWKLFETPGCPKRAYGCRGRVIAPGHPVHLLGPNSKTGEDILRKGSSYPYLSDCRLLEACVHAYTSFGRF
jgi:hypothetical protein